jgi:hypothetical protein
VGAACRSLPYRLTGMRICPLASPVDDRWRQCQAMGPGAMLVARTLAAAIAPASDGLIHPGEPLSKEMSWLTETGWSCTPPRSAA